ncbi:ABC transporter ATP-binding protein [Marinomonas balearica]|uniref:Lipopolysaccharide transport system ATP-binding protein n=1 Tax=Marinomonas balearica TaxID=491947 RepID=A0A4R6MAF6_9GAMM|nr:ABC transporter ATP-binding protein [Marinomonas balearica]TDO97199.1 lipopolysaccharide transport system ATP-binding protein [Marinomonas balearica]
MGNIVIEFQNVSKTYNLVSSHQLGLRETLLSLPSKLMGGVEKQTFTALDDISFTITQGESVGIVGRNGAGKSTLLSLMAGVIKPSSGRARVLGRVSPMLELGGGFHPDLTGRENIFLNATLMGIPKRQIRDNLERIIEFSELGNFIDQPIKFYSSGMMSKLGFSVITQLEPELLIIDEVLAVGDAKFREKCYETIHSFKNKGVTIVFVSHDSNEVMKLCDRAIWIQSGAIQVDCSAESALTLYGHQ